MSGESYLGTDALLAYQPLKLPGLDWAVVAKIDRSEALAPISRFARNIALSTAAIVLAVCLLSLLFARILTRPIKKLAEAVRRVSGGQLGYTVPVTARYEFGDLASAFNDMSASLQTKQQLIDAQRSSSSHSGSVTGWIPSSGRAASSRSTGGPCTSTRRMASKSFPMPHWPVMRSST